jgi:hypothetical protein
MVLVEMVLIINEVLHESNTLPTRNFQTHRLGRQWVQPSGSEEVLVILTFSCKAERDRLDGWRGCSALRASPRMLVRQGLQVFFEDPRPRGLPGRDDFKLECLIKWSVHYIESAEGASLPE